MERITPEQVANEIETSWQARANGEPPSFGCGWCNFAKSFGTGNACYACPIYRLEGRPCTKLPIYERYYNAVLGLWRRKIAMEIYELLVENRQRLIDAARKILREKEK